MNMKTRHEAPRARFESRFPEDVEMSGEAAEARRAQAAHALERLAILEEQDYENIVHRPAEKVAELRKRHLASRSREMALKR